jgi:hypothetical protein
MPPLTPSAVEAAATPAAALVGSTERDIVVENAAVRIHGRGGATGLGAEAPGHFSTLCRRRFAAGRSHSLLGVAGSTRGRDHKPSTDAALTFPALT